KQHETEINALKAEVEGEIARLEAEYEETVNFLTTQGSSHQETIHSGAGTKAKKNLAVGRDEGEEIVVPRGTVLSEDMAGAVLRKVQEKIEQVEADIRAAQGRARARLVEAQEDLEARIEAATAEERDSLTGELEGL